MVDGVVDELKLETQVEAGKREEEGRRKKIGKREERI